MLWCVGSCCDVFGKFLKCVVVCGELLWCVGRLLCVKKKFGKVLRCVGRWLCI